MSEPLLPARGGLGHEGQSHESAEHDVLAARAAQVASTLLFEELSALVTTRPEAPPRKATLAHPAFLGALALALAVFAYAPTLVWMWGRWEDAHGYYGHGPLIPLVTLWLIWRERGRLALAPDVAGRRGGTALVGAAVLLHAASALLENIHFVSGGSLLLALFGTALLVGGTAFARALLFPIGFLAFAVPLPMLAVARLSLELKLLAAKLALGALSVVGIAGVREGSVVHLGSGDVTVEDVCSGMRSLVALLALGVLVAGLEARRAGVRRPLLGLLVLLSVPIAIVANAARIAFLCALVDWKGTWVLDTWIHEGSGYAVFGVALALLLGTKALLLGREASPALAPMTGARKASVISTARVALVCLLLVPAAAATALFDRHVSATGGAPIGAGLPLDLGAWRGTELPIEPYVREVLETNDLISRRYLREGFGEVDLYLAASRGDRKVAHPPDVCLAGNGYTIEESREIDLARGVRSSSSGSTRTDPDVRAVELVLVRGSDEQIVVYFYAAGEQLGPSYLGLQLACAWERLFHPDVASALVRLNARFDGRTETRESALRSIRDLAQDLVPALRRRLREKTK